MSNQNTPDPDLMRDFTAQFGESKASQERLEAIAARMQAVKSMLATLAGMENEKRAFLGKREREFAILHTEISDLKTSIRTAEENLNRTQNPIETECTVRDENGQEHHHQMMHFEWIDPSGKQKKTAKKITTCSLQCDAVSSIDAPVRRAKTVLELLKMACDDKYLKEKICTLEKLKVFLSRCKVEDISAHHPSRSKTSTNNEMFTYHTGECRCLVNENWKKLWVTNEYTVHCFIDDNDGFEKKEKMLKLAITKTDQELRTSIQKRDERMSLRDWLDHLASCTGDQGDLKTNMQQLQQTLAGLNVKLHALESKLKQSQEAPSEVLAELNRTIEKYRTDVQALIGSSQTAGAPETAAE